MANRRMFAKTIIGSARFLRMGTSARLLYYDLGMYADDDGVVEAFSVMRMTGASEDDLRVLHAKGFIRILNEDLVTLINDWNTNNQIRQDRKIPSAYRELIEGKDSVGEFPAERQPHGNQVATKRQPHGNQVTTQYSIVQDSIIQNSIESTHAQERYGEYKNVILTDQELDILKREFPNDWQAKIDRLSTYMRSTGRSYRDHLATIRDWAKKDAAKAAKKASEKAAPALNYQQHTYTEDDFGKDFYYDPERDFLKGG